MKEEYTNKDLMEKLNEHSELLRILIRQKMSNKQERLFSYIKEKNKIYTKQVMAYLNISRPHALTLMERVGKYPGFKFRKGSRELRLSSFVIYDEAAIVKDQNNKILDMFKTKEIVTLHDILITFDTDITEARNIAQTFVNCNKWCKLVDNKIVKIKL